MRALRARLRASLFAALVLAGDLPAQEPVELDLLVQEALANNPDLAAALARWEAARERPRQAGSLPDPHAMAQVIRFRDRGLGVRSEGETWYSLRQEVPFPGKLGLRAEVAEHEAHRAGQEVEALRLDVAEAVRLSYYELLHARLLEDVALENQALAARTAETARTRYEVGLAPQPELVLARVEHARIANDLAEYRRMRRSAVAELAALLGRPQPAGLAAAQEAEPVVPERPLETDSLLQRALEQRPELTAARLAAARDSASLRLARKTWLPDLTLGVEYWVGEGENPSPLPDERYVLDVGLTVPWIWNDKHEAEVREARASARASRFGLVQVVNAVRREVETAVAGVEAAAEQVCSFERVLLPEAVVNVESAAEAYQTDRLDLLALLDAQRSLNDLRVGYHTARVELLGAWARLDRALGNPVDDPDGAAPERLTRGTREVSR